MIKYAFRCTCTVCVLTWALWHHYITFPFSQLSTSNKLFIYKTILKPIWAYGIQLWGTASTSNIEILERFQTKALWMIVEASWYVPNTVIRRNLQIPTVKEEIRCYSSQYSAHLSVHTNGLTANLTGLPDNKTPAKWSAYQIHSVINLFLLLVCKV
jgi:hypothetical protein